MLPMLIGAGAMAGLGVLKNEIYDAPRARQANAARAAGNAWSPWTGVRDEMIEEKNSLDVGLQGAMSGAQMGQGMMSAQSQMGVNDAYAASLKGGAAPSGAAAPLQKSGDFVRADAVNPPARAMASRPQANPYTAMKQNLFEASAGKENDPYKFLRR